MPHVQGVTQVQPTTQTQTIQGYQGDKPSNLQPGVSTITSNGPSLPVLILSKTFGGLKSCFSFIMGLFISRQPVAKAVTTPSSQEKPQPLVTDPQLKAKILKSYGSGF